MDREETLSLKNIEQKVLEEALHYMNVKELKEMSEKLKLPIKGKKKDLIKGILYYIQTGQILKQVLIPDPSKAQKNKEYSLKPDTLILFGAFKNDLATRQFMKTLVGEYFHFTAFGQDWIKERWLEGNPPTYQEFSQYWQQEYERRKKEGTEPKQEWAYLSFIKQQLIKNPKASRKEITQQWGKIRRQKVEEAKDILRRSLS